MRRSDLRLSNIIIVRCPTCSYVLCSVILILRALCVSCLPMLTSSLGRGIAAQHLQAEASGLLYTYLSLEH